MPLTIGLINLENFLPLVVLKNISKKVLTTSKYLKIKTYKTSKRLVKFTLTVTDFLPRITEN
jgi:hypothetical protein